MRRRKGDRQWFAASAVTAPLVMTRVGDRGAADPHVEVELELVEDEVRRDPRLEVATAAQVGDAEVEGHAAARRRTSAPAGRSRRSTPAAGRGVGHPQRVREPAATRRASTRTSAWAPPPTSCRAKSASVDGVAVEPHAGHRLAQVEDRAAGGGPATNATVASPCPVPAAPSKPQGGVDTADVHGHGGGAVHDDRRRAQGRSCRSWPLSNPWSATMLHPAGETKGGAHAFEHAMGRADRGGVPARGRRHGGRRGRPLDPGGPIERPSPVTLPSSRSRSGRASPR